MPTSADICDRIIEATLARKLAPGAHLGEVQLATLFACSRTVVREALTALAARRIVEVTARRGWFLVQPDAEDAQATFEARRAIETGVLRCARAVSPGAVEELRAHVQRQRDALANDDAGLRSTLLGDFHVCLARALGGPLLAAILRDLTVRTTLVAMHHQSPQEAEASCAEHAAIVDALAAGDLAAAESAMAAHLGTWDRKLHVPPRAHGLAALRHALQPAAPQAIVPIS
ncbi:GntR family transcriptional regulator [Ramlibacter sp. G-1-2-2]|uniref:GntR family transcriptional regulator n=1 Tax=Ramlibacter agri TaxID=2728837 RepID=A0A848HGI2_9BURK|nr:GntR family transcriptional regulator [Ramlibacter agri]NML48539.1 GntR family transcriptional regulator [Ramlibacter agri]